MCGCYPRWLLCLQLLDPLWRASQQDGWLLAHWKNLSHPEGQGEGQWAQYKGPVEKKLSESIQMLQKGSKCSERLNAYSQKKNTFKALFYFILL